MDKQPVERTKSAPLPHDPEWDGHSDSVGKPTKDNISSAKSAKVVYPILKSVNKELYDDNEIYDVRYPFSDLDVGQSFFVPNGREVTKETAYLEMHKAAVGANRFYGEVETDENGDEVWETVTIKSLVRNPDGTVKLQSDGKPIEGADHVMRPNLIRARYFVVRPVAKDYDIGNGKATEDGVVIIRVA